MYDDEKFSEVDRRTRALLAIGQASNFSQPSSQYKEYIHRVINRGEASKISQLKVNKLLTRLVEDGYASNGGVRYSLCGKSLELLPFEALPNADNPAAAEKAGAATNAPDAMPLPIGDGKLIEPYALPLQNTRIGRAYLDMRRHAAVMKNVPKIGLRQAEILAELELSGGGIEGKNLAGLIRKQTGISRGSDSYRKSIVTLTERGWTSFREDEHGQQQLSLTKIGRDQVAFLKRYPEYISPEMKKVQNGASFHISEYIIRELGIGDKVFGSDAELPEYSDWLVADTESLVPAMTNDLRKSEDTLMRRLYSMRVEKGYIEADVSADHSNNENIYRRIRLTKAGLELARETYQRLREDEELLDEEAVEEVSEMVDACQRFAVELGAKQIGENLRTRYVERHLFEMNQAEFELERSQVSQLFNQLRQRYVSRYSGLTK